MVEKWNPDQSATDWVEGGKSGNSSIWIPIQADESAPAGMKIMRRGEGDAEERIGSADNLEGGIWKSVSLTRFSQPSKISYPVMMHSEFCF